ncbi:MAG: glutathione peroxidase [Phycisphaerales bacterium]|nr:glutathione peroxidase [Phycisphaerales bacterium]
MNKLLLVVAASGLTLAGCSQKEPPSKPPAPPESAKPAAQAPPPEAKPTATSGALDLTVKDIDGKDVNLTDYNGRVVLIVNVASKCGYTPQYAGLESLYTSRKGKGLAVLGFPSNDFGKQEPGSEADIKAFCTDKYSVSFPMFAKVTVKGESACELYKRLAAATTGASEPEPLGEPKWNFTKYLIGRDGKVRAKFDSAVAPDDAKLVAAIDAALAAR